MMHPAHRMVSTRSTRVRRRRQRTFETEDGQKAALDTTLELIKRMRGDQGEAVKEPVMVTMEVKRL